MNKNPILLYIGSEESDQPGAIGTHTKGIVNALCQSGHFSKTYFIGGKKTKSDAPCSFKTDTQTILDLAQKPTKTLRQRSVMRIGFIRNIFKALKSIQREHANKPIVIYTRYTLGLTFLLYAGIKLTKQVTLCVEYNDITEDQLRFIGTNATWGKRGTWLRTNAISMWCLKKTEAYIFGKSTRCIAITDGIASYILKLEPKARVIVVPNASSEEIIEHAQRAHKAQVRKALSLSQDSFYLVHCGTLTLWDGLDLLINALPLCKSKDSIKLIIVGDGAAKAHLQKLVAQLKLQSTVSFMPSVNHNKAIEYVLAADIIPIIKTITSYQLSPIKYYEALAAGKPMICSDVLYINEIGTFDFGQVVRFPLQAIEIAQAIDYFVENKEKLNTWTQEITTYAQKNHLWKHRAQKIIAAIAE